MSHDPSQGMAFIGIKVEKVLGAEKPLTFSVIILL
jgi:hypothetical protein